MEYVDRAVPGAGWSYRRGQEAFARVDRLSERVWLVVEDDRFGEHPFLYIIVGAARVVLIDTGVGTADYAAFVDRFLRSARVGRPEAAALPRFVVNTHCHFDHMGGNAALAPVAEAVSASARDRAFTAAACDPARDASLARKVGCAELRACAVTRWLADGEAVSLSAEPGDVLVALHAPGHTPDSLALWLARERRLFVGDMVYRWCPIIVANDHSSLGDFAASIRRLASFVRAADAGGTVAATMSCGHNSESIPALKALDEVAALVDEVLAPTSPVSVHFERDVFSLTVRPEDLEACRRGASGAGEARP